MLYLYVDLFSSAAVRATDLSNILPDFAPRSRTGHCVSAGFRMGINVLAHQSGAASSRQAAFDSQLSQHLQAVLAGVLNALAEAAAGHAPADFERLTWHLHMGCNYLKLAASDHGAVAADATDAARTRLMDKLFLLQASLIAAQSGQYNQSQTDHPQMLLEGLELMAAVSSLLPQGPVTQPLSQFPSEY